MIQRVQNLYLLLAVICLIVAVFLPIGNANFKATDFTGKLELTPKNITLVESQYDELSKSMDLDRIKELKAGEMFLFAGWNALLILLLVFTIMRFKDLNQQFKLNKINLILSAITLIALMVGMFMLPDFLKNQIVAILDSEKLLTSYEYSTGIGFYLYFAATSFVFLANIGIRKDIRLLKSIDRIR